MASSEPKDGCLRICVARRGEHFDAVARVWAEALLLPGLTELPAPSREDELRRLTESVAQRLRQSYDRKLRAAAESRSLRRRGEALLQQLRRGGLTVPEAQLMTRQLEAIRRDLRRARRRRLWACLVAWRDGAPGSSSSGGGGGGDGDGGGDGHGGGSADGGGGGLSCGSVPQGRQRPGGGGGGGQPLEPGEGGAHLPPRTRTTSPAVAGAAAAAHCSSRAGGAGGGGGINGAGGGVRDDAEGGERHSSSSSSGCGGGGGGCCAGAVAGYVLVSLSQPLAALPPPLPSRAPQQVHVDALAVSPGQRRRGVGSALLAAAERLAGRWGASSLWLHVDSSNDAAVQLYSDRGYGIARIQAPGPLAGLAAAAAAWRAAPARMEVQRNQTPQQQGPRWIPGDGLERWRRRQRSRKFVMQKRLLPQRQGPQQQQQSQKRGEQRRRHPPAARDRPQLTVSGAAPATHGSGAPPAEAGLGRRSSSSAAADDDFLQPIPTSPGTRALAPASQGRGEVADEGLPTHGSAAPAESRRQSPSRRQAGVYEWH